MGHGMLSVVLLFAVTLCATIPTNHASCSQKPHCTLFKGQCWCKTKENQPQREACGYEVGYDKEYHSIVSTGSPHSLIVALKLTPDPIYCPNNADCSDSCAVNYCLTGDGCVGSALTCNTDKERWESLGEELVGIARCTNFETDVDAPTDGGWGNYGQWSTCSATCGGGTQTRKRTCDNPAPANGGKNCDGSASETQTCNIAPCTVAVNGNWGPFGPYGACSRSCGGGFKTRTRACNNPAPSNGGATCAGSNEERVPCNPAACPVLTTANPTTYAATTTPVVVVNGNWGAFGAYGACSLSCGGGFKVRTRACNNPAPSNGGASCAGSNEERVPCNQAACPDCQRTTGGNANGACCRFPFTYRGEEYNNCISASHFQLWCYTTENGLQWGNCVPVASDPVNGNWGVFGAYGACSRSCGGGFKVRTRACNNPAPSNGGAPCAGKNKEEVPCNPAACPVNGNWGPFGAYGACSRSCGGGFKVRTRACNNPAPSNGGAPCAGNNEERVPCNPAVCPVTTTANPQVYQRTTGGNANGAFCQFPFIYRGITYNNCTSVDASKLWCGTTQHSSQWGYCVIDGNWGAFGPYGACSRSCGGGSKVRNRTCDNPAPSNGGATCAGSNQDLVPCGTDPCNVACKKDDHVSCGSYERYKSTYCLTDDWTKTNCPKMCGSCGEPKGQNKTDVFFEHYIGACVKGSNILPMYLDQTIKECKCRCLLNPECKAIEYYHNRQHKTNNKCVMQSSKDRSGCVGPDVDLYVKVQTTTDTIGVYTLKTSCKD